MAASPPKICFRVDANETIGVGHLMRCLSMAQALRTDAGTITFLCHDLNSALSHKLVALGFYLTKLHSTPGSPEDAAETAHWADANDQAYIVIDGYHFSENYLQNLHLPKTKTILRDDFGKFAKYAVDCVLNPNPFVTEALYSQKTEPNTKLLVGRKYLSLRPEFSVHTRLRGPCSIKHLLITFGGADIDNYAGWVLKQLQTYTGTSIDIRVIVGPDCPHLSLLRAQQSQRVRILHSPSSIAEQMEWADFCIGAAGSTIWELAVMGVPSLIFCTADNQKITAELLHSQNYMRLTDREHFLNDFFELSNQGNLRSEMEMRLKTLIDSNGAMNLREGLFGVSALILGNKKIADSPV